MELVPLMVTFHLRCKYRIETKNKKFYSHIFKYVNKPKNSDLSTGQISNRVENNENEST